MLLASCAMQWLQVVTGVAYAELNGVSLGQMFGNPQMERAVGLSLVGILVLAIGMRVGILRPYRSAGAELALDAEDVALDRAFVAWLASFALASVAVISAGLVPGLNQLIYALTSLKWVFCFILAYTVLTKDSGYGLLCITILIEFVTGSLGFFAGFKEVFFMVFLAAVCTQRRLSARARALLAAAVVIVLCASLLWTAVKKDYRAFQTSDSEEAHAQKLWSLLRSLEDEALQEAADALILRVEYLQYFAHTLDHVPEVVPYERGALWKGAINHVLMPRALFPGKAALDDSARTRTYTGVRVAGADEGTSIGIGYMAESYVDFGPYGMFAPIFLLGVFFGSIYRYFAYGNPSALLGSALATAALFSTLQVFEQSNVKIVGGIITTCLILFAFDRLAGGQVLLWLRRARPPTRPPRRGRKRLQARPGPFRIRLTP